MIKRDEIIFFANFKIRNNKNQSCAMRHRPPLFTEAQTERIQLSAFIIEDSNYIEVFNKMKCNKMEPLTMEQPSFQARCKD